MSVDCMSPLQVVSRIKNGEKIHLVDVRAPGNSMLSMRREPFSVLWIP